MGTFMGTPQHLRSLAQGLGLASFPGLCRSFCSSVCVDRRAAKTALPHQSTQTEEQKKTG